MPYSRPDCALAVDADWTVVSIAGSALEERSGAGIVDGCDARGEDGCRREGD